jgi:poly(3-hydroxybutyrate) depolymerase
MSIGARPKGGSQEEELFMGRSGISMCALAFVVCCLTTAQKPAQKPRVDAAKTVAAFFEADPWTKEGRAERTRLVAELATLPPLAEGDVDKWKSACLKAWAKGPKLEKKSGQHFLWEKPEERGRYIVGGEEKKPKGLLIAMHGGGAGSGDAWSAHGPYQSPASDLGWLMICPEVLEKTEHGWTDSGSEEFVLRLVDDARRTWKIDANRVFFSGHSMGGFGTWTLGAHHADRVAALAASAGAPTPVTGPSGKYEDVDVGVVPSLRNVPLVVYQSDDDVQVPPAANDIAAEVMAKAKERWGGFEFEYWRVTGRGHGEAPGGMEALLAKIAKRVRDPRPTKIVWQPAIGWKQQFYWLWWQTPPKGALVEAELDRAKNEIRVACDRDGKGLEVLLDERLVDVKREVVVTLNGKEVFRGKPTWSLATIAKTSQTGDEELCYGASIPLAP